MYKKVRLVSGPSAISSASIAMRVDCFSGHRCQAFRSRCYSHNPGYALRQSVRPQPAGLSRLICNSRRSNQLVKAEKEPEGRGQRALAPVEVKTAVGKMLDYYLKMEPHLLSAVIERQLEQLQSEKDAVPEQSEGSQSPPSTDQRDLVLYRRMDEVRQQERRASLEELMYICVLEKFMALGVHMMPRIDLQLEPQGGTIKALTEGIHSQEALEMVKEQVRMLMGQATLAYDAAVVKMPKLQAVQLERSAGIFEGAEAKEEAVNRLERLFNQADSLDMSDTPDSPSTSSASDNSSSERQDTQSDASSSSASSGDQRRRPRSGALRQYVDSFGPDTIQEMARVVSQEAATIIEMQSVALFGDYRLLQEQMEKAIGSNFVSMEDLMERVRKEMESGAIESVTLTVGTQRRAILEAIAFGTFLRDVETMVDSQYGLLTAAKTGRGPQGGNGPSGLAGAL